MTRRDLERKYANTRHWPLPPRDIPGGVCRCGAVYMDSDAGHDAHELVFGHRPQQTGGGTEPSTPSRQGTDGRNLAPDGSSARPVNTVPPPPARQPGVGA